MNARALMETVREAQHRIQEGATSSLYGARNWLQHSIQNSADTLRLYARRYPPLAAFLFTLIVFSAVPITIFLIYGSVTAMAFFSMAMIGFSIVEGLALLGGGGILLCVLGVVLFMTSIGFLWMSGIYLAYRSFCFFWHKMPSISNIPGVSSIPVVGSLSQGVQALAGQSSTSPGQYTSYQNPQSTSSGSGGILGSFLNPSQQ